MDKTHIITYYPSCSPVESIRVFCYIFYLKTSNCCDPFLTLDIQIYIFYPEISLVFVTFTTNNASQTNDLIKLIKFHFTNNLLQVKYKNNNKSPDMILYRAPKIFLKSSKISFSSIVMIICQSELQYSLKISLFLISAFV